MAQKSTFAFPTVEDCQALRGDERDILHDFDQRLREVSGQSRLKACALGLDDRATAMACVTTMMTVAASLALAASQGPADVEAGSFSMMAVDALAWAKFCHRGCQGRPQQGWGRHGFARGARSGSTTRQWPIGLNR